MNRPFRLPRHRGSALITVVMLIAMFAILTASMLHYTLSERRGNERNRLILRAKNMAENVALYSAEQISTKLHRLKTVANMQFTNGSNALHLPPSTVLTTAYSTSSGVEAYAGIISNTGLTLVTDPTNINYGLQALTANVPIIAKSTMTHAALGSITTYAEQDLQVSEVPLFQFAIFYDPDLEFAPGADMVISGPVNTNGNLIARDQTGFSNTVQFKGRVTAVGGFFANTAFKGTTYNEFDSADSGPGGTGPLYFQNAPTSGSATVTNIQSGSLWRDHLWGGSTVTTTSVANFKTFATSAFGGNFQTSAMGVGPLTLPGIDTTTANTGRAVIQIPDNTNDSANLISAGTQVSRKAGLYIIVNPTATTRTGHLPYEPAHSPSSDATVSMRAYSYRCFLDTLASDGVTHTIQEVILPGQPSYGAANAYVNNLPNAYRVNTAVGSNQVLRIPQGGGVDLDDTGYDTGTPTMSTFQDAYFYDLRRATNSNGHPFSRSTLPFTPRPITKIDFDMTRFHLMFARTYNGATSDTVFNPGLPNATNWANSTWNASSTSASVGLGLATPVLPTSSTYSVFPSADMVTVIQKTVIDPTIPTISYSPSTLTIAGNYQTGSGGTVTAYAGRFKVETSSSAPASQTTSASPYTWSSTAFYTSTANESSITLTPSALPSGTTAIRITQYAYVSGTPYPLDVQVIPIVTTGTTVVTPALSNSYFIVPDTAIGTGFLNNNGVTDMHVYVGGEDDTANWTFSTTATTNSTNNYVDGALGSASATTAAQTGAGQFENRYTLSNSSTALMLNTASTGYVTITATKGGSTISQAFALTKQSSLGGGLNTTPLQTGYFLSVTNGQAPDPFQMYFAPSNPSDALIQSDPSSFAVEATDLYNAGTGPWSDGISIYVESVDAEVTTSTSGVRDRMDSGLRLWNGRGPAASFTATGTTGFSICTNDPVYIVGNFNADGNINATSTSTTNPGGYSAMYPDSSSEYLAAVMGDALTILSQPTYSTSTSSGITSYYQSAGWSDSLSATRGRTSAYSSSWATTNPNSSNSTDGLSASVTPSYLPNLGNTSGNAGAGSAQNVQFNPTTTEVSACLLAGIVPTTSHQNSGGAHNFPRLLENWDGTGLYIRGSMVCTFASVIATEPWSIRIYSGAGRYWGLHYTLTSASHHLPLEPMAIGATRLAYRELNATDYAALKAQILALPAP